jgi:hypothetical protein
MSCFEIIKEDKSTLSLFMKLRKKRRQVAALQSASRQFGPFFQYG